jgi:hypothetical protein
MLHWEAAKAQFPDSFSRNKMGNNPGNIINYGLIASDDQRIYYCNTISGGLFSKKIDGTDLKRLTDAHVEFINVSHGWLYYRRFHSENDQNIGGLYKMKIDGTQEQQLTSDEPFYINVVDDWIYYINWSHSTDVYKVRVDGTSRQILYSGHYQCLTTDGNSLYFGKMAGSGTSILCNGSFDGHEIKTILKDTVESPFVYEDWIYYKKDYNKVCRINKRTYKIDTLLFDHNLDADYIIPDRNFLYFGGVLGIHKFDILERKLDNLFSSSVTQLNLASNYFYFTAVKWDRKNEAQAKSYLLTADSLKLVK